MDKQKVAAKLVTLAKELTSGVPYNLGVALDIIALQSRKGTSRFRILYDDALGEFYEAQ